MFRSFAKSESKSEADKAPADGPAKAAGEESPRSGTASAAAKKSAGGSPKAGAAGTGKAPASAAKAGKATASTAKAAGTALLAQDPGSAPPPVQRACRLMFFGAMATVVWGVFGVIVDAVWQGATVTNGSQKLSAGQVKGALVLITIVEAVLFTVLWLWMSRMNRDGRSWARIVSSILFLGWSYATYQAIGGLNNWVAVVDLVIALVIWGLGVGAVYYLWQSESSAFYKSSAKPDV